MKGVNTMHVVTSAKIRRDLRAQLTKRYPNVHFSFFENIKGAEQELPSADILITYGEDLTNNHIGQAKNLKWIMVISAGMDRMPFKAIAKTDILVTNARGIHQTPMAEYTIAMMLQVGRKTKMLIKQEQESVWNRKLTMTELKGKTLGVLGAGAIGTEIARLSKAFGMKTIGMNRSGRKVEFFDHIVTFDNMDSILTEADFLVSVLPQTAETKELLNYQSFVKMKNDAVFINIGRGTVINENDLIQALKSSEIAHAVLDVFEEEPLPSSHPLWEMDQVTVTPHISGISPGYQPRAVEIFEENLKVFLEDGTNYYNKIDPKRGY